jgi:SNF2 family DNA or RNA helicase
MYKSKTPPTPGVKIRCRDAEWLIHRVEGLNFSKDYAIHCVGIDDLVRGHHAIFLSQLDDIVPVDPSKTILVEDTSSGYKLSKLFVEAQLRQMPSTGIEPDFDGMGVFKQMKFQEEAVQKALMQLRPRLLLADAVGLGKTIEIGMILTELIRRGRADRILVLAKKSMLTQFQAELWNRFNIPLVRMDSTGIARLRLKIPGNKNPFDIFHRVIISMDTLKNVARYEHFLKNTRWDVVIIDEAHNVAGASVPERHLSYRLARLLSRRTDSMLLTTATPHNGKKETFGRLISLLDPSAIPDIKEYDADDIKSFFLMRFKEDIRKEAADMLADRIIIPRDHTSKDASPEEENIYQILANLRLTFTHQPSNTSPVHKKTHHRLFQYGLYKLFLSSPEACLETILKRMEKIDNSFDTNLEMTHLQSLCDLLKNLTIKDSTRYQILRKQLAEIHWTGQKKSPKVLIFTEYRKTQELLAKSIAEHFKLTYSDAFDNQPRQIIASIHGSTPDIHLMNTIEAFATASSPLRLLIATDVASEGINLHHDCHHIIHYDLPWSIITLIQRNGRIDRMGQKKNPILRYLMVHTRQGLLSGDKAIFDRLIDKVEEINHLRQTGESVLNLYDSKAEEDYIANDGILKNNPEVFEKKAVASLGADLLEASAMNILLNNASQAGHEEMMRFLCDDDFSADHSEQENNDSVAISQKLRLFSDKAFFIDGYQFLRKTNSDYLPLNITNQLIILDAPTDLKRYLGKSETSGVVFGATAIPSESWPKNDQFRLTDEPDNVEIAIQAARNTDGYWSQELLLNDHHPIMKWITQRILMEVKRGEAPIILSPHLTSDELCFCFMGQISSRAGTPLIIDGHAFSFYKGGKIKKRTLKEALEATQFDQLPNTGQKPNIEAANALIHSAVTSSMQHMMRLRAKRENRLIKPLRIEEERLKNWQQRREELLQKRMATHGKNHPKYAFICKEIQEMKDYVNDRHKNWYDTHFKSVEYPTTRLIIVIQGTE